MKSNLNNYFKDFVFLNDKIVSGFLPEEIFLECRQFASYCRKFKDHPLSELMYLDNIGKNNFQMFIPFNIIDESFLLPYLHLLGKHYSKANNIRLRKVKKDDFSVAYDIWLNFCYKNDTNELHAHRGLLSGIIFIKNDNQPTYFEDGFSLHGKEGQIVLFPAFYQHEVKEKLTDNERITISFNLDTKDSLE